MISIEMVSSALLLGLMGSLHCLSMCGPLVLALPESSSRSLGFTLENAGRMTTYVLLGFLFGQLGEFINMGLIQQKLTIGLGVTLLLFLLLPSSWKKKWKEASIWKGYTNFLKKFWIPLFQIKSKKALFALGCLHGFLPCGLVAIALAGSLATAGPVQGGLFMFFFGLSTIPVLSLTYFFGKKTLLTLLPKKNQLIKLGLFSLAGLLIVRGLSLDIPWVSPLITEEGTQCSSCKH